MTRKPKHHYLVQYEQMQLTRFAKFDELCWTSGAKDRIYHPSRGNVSEHHTSQTLRVFFQWVEVANLPTGYQAWQLVRNSDLAKLPSSRNDRPCQPQNHPFRAC